jgi:hypothetical protein
VSKPDRRNPRRVDNAAAGELDLKLKNMTLNARLQTSDAELVAGFFRGKINAFVAPKRASFFENTP